MHFGAARFALMSLRVVYSQKGVLIADVEDGPKNRPVQPVSGPVCPLDVLEQIKNKAMGCGVDELCVTLRGSILDFQARLRDMERGQSLDLSVVRLPENATQQPEAVTAGKSKQFHHNLSCRMDATRTSRRVCHHLSVLLLLMLLSWSRLC